MKIKKFYLSVLVFLIPIISLGQDSHLSQFFAAPLYLNPALTGDFVGDHRFIGNYRSQWRSFLKSAAFNTTAASYDMKKNPLGVGFQILNSRAGRGSFNVLNFNVTFSYDLELTINDDHQFSVGLQPGIIQKSFNTDLLLFNNQYNDANGGAFDPTQDSREDFSRTSKIIPDINLGFYWRYRDISSKYNPFLGLSAFHLTEPKENFFKYEESKLPMRLAINGGTQIALSRITQIKPEFLIMKQGNAHELLFNLSGFYYLRDANAFLLYGASFRNTSTHPDALVTHFGMKFRKFTYRISYDFNVSSLIGLSRARGGFELSIQYVMTKIPIIKHQCPRL